MSLPLKPDDKLKRVINRSELSSVDKIKIDGVLNITVPYTRQSKLIFSRFFDPNVPDNNYEAIEARIWRGSRLLRQRYIRPVRKDDSSCTYTIEVTYDQDHWANALEDCKLCDLDVYDDFVLTKENIEQNWVNDYRYINGGRGYVFPPAWYGATSSPNTFTAEDFRPWFHVFPLLKNIFCKAGWNFKAPILETDIFKQVILYLSDDTYGDSSDENFDDYKLFVRSFNQGVNWNQIGDNEFTSTWVINEFIDPQGQLQTSASEIRIDYSKQLFADFCVFYEIDLITGTGSGVFNGQLARNVYLEVILNDNTNGLSSVIHSEQIDVEIVNGNRSIVRGEFSIDCQSLDYALLFDNNIAFRLRYTGANDLVIADGVDVINEIKIWNKPKRFRYTEGSTIKMSDVLTCNKSGMDVLKMILHLFDGKYKTDWGNRCVEILPAKDIIIDGELVKGLEQEDEPIDITDRIICNIRNSSIPSNKGNRYCVYGFKKSTDNYIKSLPEYKDSNSNPFDYEIDLGEQFKDDTTYKRNPFLEPTILREISTHTRTNTPVHLPNLTDSEDEISYNVGCRMLYINEPVDQFYVDGIDHAASTLNWYDSFRIIFPTAFMSIEDENVAFDFIPGQGQDKPSITYEHYFGKNFIESEAIRRLLTVKDKFEIITKGNFFDLVDPNQPICFNYKGKPFRGYIDSLEDECGQKGILTPIYDRSTLNDCIDDDVDDRCSNVPRLQCEQEGNCFDLYYGGFANSVINSITWTAEKYNGTGYDAPITIGSGMTAQICGISDTHRITMIVEYEGCPTLTRTKIINPCSNDLQLAFDCYLKQDGQSCFKFYLVGSSLVPIDQTVFQVQINGATPFTAQENTEYCIDPNLTGDIEVCVFGEVSFEGSCPAIELEDCKTFPIEVPDCDLTDIQAVCIRDEDGCYTFDYSGNLSFDPAMIQLQYRMNGEVCNWDKADDCVTPNGEVEARVVIIFCNDRCPVYCSPWINCNDCDYDFSIDCEDCEACVVSNDDISGVTFTWTAPSGFNQTGNCVTLADDIDQTYTVVGIDQNGCEVVRTYVHDAPNAGTPISNIITVS